MANLSQLQTEQRNPRSMHIDRMETLDMLRVINREDHHVAEAVEKELPNIDNYKISHRLVLSTCGRSIHETDLEKNFDTLERVWEEYHIYEKQVKLP